METQPALDGTGIDVFFDNERFSDRVLHVLTPGSPVAKAASRKRKTRDESTEDTKRRANEVASYYVSSLTLAGKSGRLRTIFSELGDRDVDLQLPVESAQPAVVPLLKFIYGAAFPDQPPVLLEVLRLADWLEVPTAVDAAAAKLAALDADVALAEELFSLPDAVFAKLSPALPKYSKHLVDKFAQLDDVMFEPESKLCEELMSLSYGSFRAFLQSPLIVAWENTVWTTIERWGSKHPEQKLNQLWPWVRYPQLDLNFLFGFVQPHKDFQAGAVGCPLLLHTQRYHLEQFNERLVTWAKAQSGPTWRLQHDVRAHPARDRVFPVEFRLSKEQMRAAAPSQWLGTTRRILAGYPLQLGIAKVIPVPDSPPALSLMLCRDVGKEWIFACLTKLHSERDRVFTELSSLWKAVRRAPTGLAWDDIMKDVRVWTDEHAVFKLELSAPPVEKRNIKNQDHW